MSRIPKWILVVMSGLLVAFAGCVADTDDDDNGDDDDFGGTVEGGGDNDDDNGDNGDDGATGTVEGRGSPGWGLIGSVGAVLAVGYMVRKRLQ